MWAGRQARRGRAAKAVMIPTYNRILLGLQLLDCDTFRALRTRILPRFVASGASFICIFEGNPWSNRGPMCITSEEVITWVKKDRMSFGWHPVCSLDHSIPITSAQKLRSTTMVAKNWSELMTPYPNDDNIMELSLMMSRHQFDALEQRASSQGVSVAHFLRQLVYESTTIESNALVTE